MAMAKRTWSRRGVHYTTSHEDYYTSYRCAIVAVNSSLGLINHQIYDSAVDEEVFL
jgi:hypothetical protein